MKATDVLRCIMYMDMSGEDFYIIEVPTEDDEWNPQTEEWWDNQIGGCPPSPIESGEYLCLYPNDARDFLQTDKELYMPNAEVEVSDSIVYLYKLED